MFSVDILCFSTQYTLVYKGKFPRGVQRLAIFNRDYIATVMFSDVEFYVFHTI